MRATFINAPGDIEVADAPQPHLVETTDVVVEVSATCVCGSDLWSYRGVKPVPQRTKIGHEFVGIVREVGSAVTTVREGQFVVSPFLSSCNSCPNCRAGFHGSCQTLDWFDGCQAQVIRVPQADGTLVGLSEQPDPELLPSLLACSDVMGTGWHAAVMAGVRDGMTVAVVGDGAVGLCGVIAARQLGAKRIIAMSRHESRQNLARNFGATDIVAERGEAGATRVRDLTDGIGADAVLECVGTRDSLLQALATARPGSLVGYVGVPHGVELKLDPFFRKNVGLRGGMAPVRAYLPDLLERVLDGRINPGKVFDLTLPLEQAPEAYAAMDERRAIKVLLTP